MPNDNNQNTIFDSRKEQKKQEELQKRILAARRSAGIFEAGDRDARVGTSEHKPEIKEESKYTRIAARKEFTVFRRAEYEDNQLMLAKIEEVRKEIILAIKQMREMRSSIREVERAAFENIPNPGIYHANFFERLKNMLMLFRKNIKQSKNWLDLTFSRMMKKRYWNRAKKGGSSYMLSDERRMATQAG